MARSRSRGPKNVSMVRGSEFGDGIPALLPLISSVAETLTGMVALTGTVSVPLPVVVNRSSMSPPVPSRSMIWSGSFASMPGTVAFHSKVWPGFNALGTRKSSERIARGSTA